jgi:UDP-N-acetylglucosamine 2-epimerase (non-hydrolysing)
MKEGKPTDVIHLVGDVMIDNLFYQNAKLNGNKVSDKPYVFLTLHRQGNVDNRETLGEIISGINAVAENLPVYFPVHPRTKKMIKEFDIELHESIFDLPPLGFMDSLIFWREAQCVFTDSGGLQAETSALGIPCVTIRENTERPSTIEFGTNVLSGMSREGILKAYEVALGKKGQTIPLSDGKTSERIWRILNT